MIRTDLAMETREMRGNDIPGVISRTEEASGGNVTTVEITNDEGAQIMGRPKGVYVTIEAEDISSSEERRAVAKLLSRELSRLMEGKKADKVLVVGLGNHLMTPDSIGVNAAEKIFVTRHLRKHLPDEFGSARSVSAITPGVLGLTGIETGETVGAVVAKIQPDLIIAADALASRSMSRIGRTFQLTDTGISPGSGVGNSRKELSENTLGVPVIALGVPMVADAATVADDAIRCVIDKIKEEAEVCSSDEALKMLRSLEDNDRYALIYEALEPSAANMFVTPKDVDSIAGRVAEILRDGINNALHGNKFEIFY